MKHVLSAMLALSIVIIFLASSGISQPVLNPPPSSLPATTYYSDGTHYTMSDPEWNDFFTSVIDNKSYVTYNWTNVDSQDLIVFDLSYTGLNPFGMELICALSGIGFPSVANMTKAFVKIENKPSQVSGYSNIQALDGGAYPGFSFSKPVVNHSIEYYGIAGIVVLFGSIFVLYYVFNRKK